METNVQMESQGITKNGVSSNEVRYGGLLLSMGALITVICIVLEVNAGWASFSKEIVRTDLEAGTFLFQNWDKMNVIWSFSLFGNIPLAIAALLLQKHAKKIGALPLSLFWLVHFIGSILIIIAFGISVGSYFPAMEVLNEQPALFSTIRGAPMVFFNFGALCQLFALPIFFHSGFSKSGPVEKKLAIICLILILLAIVLSMVGLVSFAVVAISFYIPSIVLGIVYWQKATS